VIIAGTQALQSLSTVLCLGAHADDIEIGCGGTLLKLRQLNPGVKVRLVVFSANEARACEARQGAEAFGPGAADDDDLIIKDFRESYFPYHGSEIKEYFDHLGETATPGLIFTHYRHDLHQDHRIISDLTWNTFRDHLILEYEIPKYDGDLGTPNIFVQLDDLTCQRKIDLLHSCFPSQATKPWFSRETFLATLRLRGIESRAREGYAEAFHGRKLILA
jgi:LmbE family N-acetylglucosaminyl deacetylase